MNSTTLNRVNVKHVTEYRYESSVSSSYGQVCLLPRETDGQRCVASKLTVEPMPSDSRERVDFYGNRIGYFHVGRGHTLLRITAESEVAIDRPLLDSSVGAALSLASAVAGVEALTGPERVEAMCYRLPSPRTPIDEAVVQYAESCFDGGGPIGENLAGLMHRIHGDFDFAPDATEVTSTVADLFESGAGVCQDFAHLAVSCLRSAGLPARYVSGYMETDPPPGKEKILGADVSHAWVSAMIPGLGWIDIDPTNDQFVNERYVTTAWGRDYSDVSPVAGVIYSDGGTTTLKVSVDVTKLD